MLEMDRKDLRAAFGMFATGVTIVTTLDQNNMPVGFTANSFTSVSLNPPMVLVCMSQTSRSHGAISKNAGFSVSILARGQDAISRNFSTPDIDRFANNYWHSGPSGRPLINGCSAWFDCTRDKIIDAGDHSILLGKVIDFGQNNNPPLVLSQSRFH